MRRASENLLVRLAGTAAAATALLLTGACAAAPHGRSATGAPATSAAAPSAAAPSAATGSAGPVCSGFSLQLAAGVTGQVSPVEAARWFAGHGRVANVPPDGWREAGRDETGALVRSGQLTLHVVQGSDGTWLVDSGRTC